MEIGTNRKTICDFHCNNAYLLSLTKYNDLLVENLRFFDFFTHPFSFEALAWKFPWDQGTKLYNFISPNIW